MHSRGGGAIPLGGGGISKGIAGGIHIRDDIDVPVFMFETETDEAFLRYFDARQPDADHLGSGTSRAPRTPTRSSSAANRAALHAWLQGPINTAPTHYVVAAALDQLDRGSAPEPPPPSAPRMEVTLVDGKPTIRRDALGNAIGGVRTAAERRAGRHALGRRPTSKTLSACCSASTMPFDHATLNGSTRRKAAYLAKFTQATDKAIASGYVLPADRAAILAEAAKTNF